MNPYVTPKDVFELQGDKYVMIPIPKLIYRDVWTLSSANPYLSGADCLSMDCSRSFATAFTQETTFQFYFPLSVQITSCVDQRGIKDLPQYPNDIPFKPCLIPLNQDGTMADLRQLDTQNPTGSVVRGGNISANPIVNSNGDCISHQITVEDAGSGEQDVWIWVHGLLVYSKLLMMGSLNSFQKAGLFSAASLALFEQAQLGLKRLLW